MWQREEEEVEAAAVGGLFPSSLTCLPAAAEVLINSA